jgi:hypothetical protein
MRDKNSFRLSVILLALLFWVLSVGPVLSLEWTKLATTGDGNELSYNKGSVRKTDTNIYRLWERIIYATRNVKENIKTTLFIREINCQDGQHRIISVMDYNANGEKLFSGSNDQVDWSSIPPNTPIDDLRKVVCPQDDKSTFNKLHEYLFP